MQHELLEFAVRAWPSASIALPVGPFEPDQLLVLPNQRCWFHDPNDVSHLLDRAPVLAFSLVLSTTSISFSPRDSRIGWLCLRS